MIKATFVILALAAAGSVKAQTYDPVYPVCMHVVAGLSGQRMDCIFTSLAQCAQPLPVVAERVWSTRILRARQADPGTKTALAVSKAFRPEP